MTTTIDPSTIRKQGFLEKKGGQVKNWKKRWFVITGKNMYYFKDVEMKELAGEMTLVDTTVTLEEATEGPGFYFMVRFPVAAKSAARSEYLVRAQTAEERDSWIETINRATTITIFGKPLSNALKVNPDRFGFYLPIPYFFKEAIEYIKKNSMDVEGIYRLNGSSAQIESFKETINANKAVTFSDPHSTTGLIKLYMRTLPEPLFLKKNYQMLKTCISLTDETKQIECVSQILRSLPISNYIILHYLFSHLSELLKHEENTKMDARNIAVCIGPSILTSDEDSTNGAYNESSVQQNIGVLLITHFDDIFGINPLLQYGSNSVSRICKVLCDVTLNYPYILQAPKDSVVQVVSEDQDGWCVCVYNDQWGVLHTSQMENVNSQYEMLKGLARQDNKWVLSSSEISKLAEKCPEAVQLYEALSSKLTELRNKAKRII